MVKFSTKIICIILMVLSVGIASATTVEFNTSGYWEVPAGVTSVNVTVVAGGCGGGGGGDGGTYAGEGGGGGAYGNVSTDTDITVTPEENITITVGAGGTGGANGTENGESGNAGGSSSFGAYLSATPSGVGGYGGEGNFEDPCSAGHSGGVGYGTGTYSSPGSNAVGGCDGGAAVEGWGAGGGGGGGGGIGLSGGSGGAGASGIVIITYESPVSPITDFTSNVTEGLPSFAVSFTDSSVNATAWNWSFGDGEYSDEQNPTHTYDSWIGDSITKYTVVLTASNEYTSDEENKTDYITAYPLITNFSSNVTSGYAPSWGVVEFTSDVTNGTATAWNWSFGDGYYSNDENPTHSYTSVGTYNVTLNASNSYSYDIEEKIGYITITSAPVPVAAFAADDTSGPTPHTVTFTDATTNTPTAWNWYYNSGSGWVLFNTSQNPVRTFSSIGTYHIKLVASNIYGNDAEEKTSYITVTEEEPEAWLPGYYSRCTINITGDDSWDSPISDYPVQLYVYATSGTSSGIVLYTGGDSLSNIRFTDTSNNLLTYTFVSTNEVYVKIPLIQNSSTDENATQIYMYYNPLMDQSSLSTWVDGGAFLFGDGFTEATLNSTIWNVSVNDITYTTNPFHPTASTYVSGYTNFYDVYNQNSMASQLQANWTVPDNVEIVSKSRMVTSTSSGSGTSGFGFVNSNNTVSAYIGHGKGDRLNYTCSGSCAKDLYIVCTFYVSEYRYLIENTRQYVAYPGGPWENWGCGYAWWDINYFPGFDITRYFIIEREGTDVRLLQSLTGANYGNYVYNSTSNNISKFALIAGSRHSSYEEGYTSNIPPIDIYYVFARALVHPYPSAEVVTCESNDPGNIEFDRSTYAASDMGTVATNVPDVFWDTLTYTYSAHIYRSTDLVTPVKSWTVSTQSQTESVDMEELGAGTYYAYLYMHGGTSYLIDSDTATVYNAFILSGYTYDGPAGTILEGVDITATQAGTPHTNASIETGYYEFDPMSIGTAISILATKTDYTNYSESITPLAATRVVKNISLVPNDTSEYWTLAGNGTACGGFVFTAPYNATATGANVTLSNGTWSSSLTVGPSGWYFFDGLANAEEYGFNATLTPYIPITSNVTTGTDDFTRKDFVFAAGTFDLTVYVLDSVTGGLMTTNSTITINDGAGTIESQTVSNGTALFENLYGTYTITVSSTGYTTSTRTVLMDADKYVAITLSVASDGGGTSTYYTPHEVRFIVQNNYGAGLSGTTVTITPTTSTLDTVVDWFQSILGLPEDTGIQTEVLTGVTDSNGGINFVMVKEILYSVQCVNTAKGCSETRTLYPKDDAYVITCDTNDDFSQNNTIIQDNITWSFTNVSINDTHEMFVFTYYDPTGQTTNVSFWVRTHKSPLSTCHQEYCDTPNSCTASYTASCAGGAEYYAGCTVCSNNHGTWETMQVYHYPLFVDLGIESGYYPYIAVAFLIVIAALFSVISVKFGAVLIPIFGFMFYYMRWLPFDIRGIGLLTLLLTIGIFAYIRKQEDKVGG